MNLPEALRTGLREIRAHKLRSGLSCLSISIGVAAMIYTFSQIEGMTRRMKKAEELGGPGRLQIEANQGYRSKGLSKGLTFRDAEKIRERWPELYMVRPLKRSWGKRVAHGRFHNDQIQVVATTPEYTRREWVYETRGRFFNEEDHRTAARVCVLVKPGGWVKKPFWARYFPPQALGKALDRQDWLGHRIRIDEHLFMVIGILQEPPKDKDPRWFRNWSGGQGIVIVPASTYRYTLARSGGASGVDAADEIAVDTGDAETAAAYRRGIELFLKNLHRGEADFKIRDYREIMQEFMAHIRKLAFAILTIGIVAILAGGIGIMNVTLATVFSRVREIGIRRALGATRGDILGQFLTEAVLLGGVGGLVGSGLGAVAVAYLTPRADRMGEVSLMHVLSAFGAAAAAAFLFALWPAYQASRLDPVESLRYE